MRDRYGAKAPASLALRFHTQTMGSTLTAQQPQNNIVRTAIEALSAVLGGTQSLHTNAYDEALGLPTEESVRIALRTQQIIAEESGVAETIDPLGGAHAIEALTADIERRTLAEIAKIDHEGGALAGIERGYQQRAIEDSAYKQQRAIESKEKVIVGVNAYRADSEPTDRESGVAKFVADHPKPTLHHVCYVVEDLAGTLGQLQRDGVELVDRVPRRGAEGMIAFIHPRASGGVLIELIDRASLRDSIP